MRRLYIGFLASLVIAFPNYGKQASTKVVVFWMPPQVETYTPVTMQNIEDRAFKVVSIRNEKQAGQLIGLVQTSDQRFASGRIRIKITTEHGFYDFDASGLGVSSTGKAMKINIEKLKQVLCE